MVYFCHYMIIYGYNSRIKIMVLQKKKFTVISLVGFLPLAAKIWRENMKSINLCQQDAEIFQPMT